RVVASAGAELLRARRHESDHRTYSEAERSADLRRDGGRSRTRLARAGTTIGRARRSRARSCGSQTAAAGGSASLGSWTCALPAASERRAETIRHRAMGPRAFAVDAVRRHHPGDRHDESDTPVAAPHRASVLAVGASEIRLVSVPVSAVRDPPPRAAAGHRAPAK